MLSHVVVLPEGGAVPVREWSARCVYKTGELVTDEGAEWKELCRLLVSLVQTEQVGSTEVFLCLLGDELVVRRDWNALSRLLTLARDYSWGARLFLVASKSIRVSRALCDGKEALRQWLNAAIRGRAMDFLQMDYSRWDTASISMDRLRDAVSRANIRREIIGSRDLMGEGWLCVLDPKQRLLIHLLSPLVEHARASDDGANLLIVIDKQQAELQKGTVMKILRKHPNRKYLVATLRTQPTVELYSCCHEHEIPDPIDFKGEMELWYFLLCLNEGHHLVKRPDQKKPVEHQRPRANSLVDDRIRPVPVNVERTFWPANTEQRPVIVVTSAFNPDEIDQCLEASRDVGWLVEQSPLGSRFFVEPAITPARLFRITKRVSDLSVWVHLGHGDSARGLEEAGSGLFLSPEQWLQCFLGRDLRLSVVMFLTCCSAPIGRLFAHAGAGVAIGFEGEIESGKSRELAVEVLEAILRKGMGQPAVLEGFRWGHIRLETLKSMHSKPIAFFSVST